MHDGCGHREAGAVVTMPKTGKRHHKAKLTTEDVDLMRQCYEIGGFTYKKLAEKFDCGESTVRDIVKYRTRLIS